MANRVIPTDPFLKELAKLRKKYPSLDQDVVNLANKLTSNAELGESLGTNLFKIRMSIKSKGKGKRGGARVITYLINQQNEVYLISIYDKSEIDSVSKEVLKSIADQILRDRPKK